MSEKFIPLSVPNLNGNELMYLTDAVASEWVSTNGKYVNQFEEKICNYVSSKGAVSCQNGTSGLHISLILSGVLNNEEVIVPALTFIAAVNPVRYVGAEPIFMDCDNSLCMDPNKLNEFCEKECDFNDNILINRKTKKRIRALIVVHVFGNMADMENIMKVAKKYNLKVIEDATEALGTYYLSGDYKNKYAGTIGDIGVYSFNGNKIITTGGGGMIVTSSVEYLKKAKHLTTQAKSDELCYTHDDVGYNYRMTNLQAALGVAQLEQLELFINTKKENFEYYKQEIDKIYGLKIINFRNNIRPNYWFYGLFIDFNYKVDKNELIKILMQHNIQSRPIWGLINEQLPYKNNESYKIEKAYFFSNHIINIPCSSNLTKKDVNSVIAVL